MDIHLKIIGCLLIGLSAMHLILPRYFNWKTELPQLGLFNRQMVRVHTLFIAIIVAMMGLLCLMATEDLQSTDLGKLIARGLAIFWTMRLFIQVFGYSTKLWRGKMFETIIHVAFTIFWFYMSVVFTRIGFIHAL